MKKFPCLALACALAGVGACGGGSMTPTPLQPTVFTITTMPSLADMLAPKTLGPASARNTIIEYVSFWNTASQTFHLNTFPQLKTQYVDTGSASITLVNVILPQAETANASMLARCAGTHFWDAVDTIFRNQASWLSATDPAAAVRQLMMNLGMSPSLIDTCLADNDLLLGLESQAAAPLSAQFTLPDGSTVTGLQVVPAVVVNGTRLDGLNSAGVYDAQGPTAPTLANIAKYIK